MASFSELDQRSKETQEKIESDAESKIEKIRQAQQFLISELKQIGFTVLPSKTNFFLVKVGNGRKFRSCLLRRGIMVRDCASFGLSEYVRIASHTMPECQKLITTIKMLKREGEL